MNDFSVKAIDRNTLENLDTDQIIAFTYAEKDARRFSGMLDIAVIDGDNFTFYFDNYLDSEISLKEYAKLLLPLMRSPRLEMHIRNLQKSYAEERLTSFDGITFSLGAFSRTWMHYLIGDGRHLFINRKQEVYIEELAAAISENVAQSNVVPDVKIQLDYVEKYWQNTLLDIFEFDEVKYAKPNQAEQQHLTAKKAQFFYCAPGEIRLINQSNNVFRAYEVELGQLNLDAQQLLAAPAVENQSSLVGASGIELDYFFHSLEFYFVNNDWIHIALKNDQFILIRREYFDQAMRLCNYYRRQDLYEAIVDGKGMRDNSLRYLFDFYWRICALRLAANSEPYTKSFQDYLDVCPLTQHAYNLVRLESTMNNKINLRKIVDLANLVSTYIDDIPDDKNAKYAYPRRDIILAATVLAQLPQRKYREICEIYGQSVGDIVKTVRKFKREKPENLSLSESLILTANIIRKLKDDFASLDIADFYRKATLKTYLEQISFIISDRDKLPYTETGEFAGRNALWFTQLQILQMRIDYLLDN